MADKTTQAGVKPSKIISFADFKKADGTMYGGEFNILSLKVNEGTELKYAGSKVINTEFGEATSHIAEDVDGKVFNLPLGAIFQKNLELSGVAKGDTFMLFRIEDSIGKKGVSKNKVMENYAIKITKKAAVTA